MKSSAMNPDPTTKAHPTSQSLWAQGCILSPLSTMTVAGQDTLPSSGVSEPSGVLHRDQRIHTAPGSSRRCSTWRCFPGGTASDKPTRDFQGKWSREEQSGRVAVWNPCPGLTGPHTSLYILWDQAPRESNGWCREATSGEHRHPFVGKLAIASTAI